MSTEREKVDAQRRIYLNAKHSIGPTELELLFKTRSDYAKLEAEHAALRAKADRMVDYIEAAMILTPEHEGCYDMLDCALADYRGEGKP